MADQRKRVGQHVTALYRAGDQNPLRWLLDQASADALSRQLHYFHYLSQARRERIAFHLAAEKQVRLLDQFLQHSLRELHALQQTAEQQQTALVALREDRARTLAQVDADLQAKSAALSQLEKDRAALQQVVDRIEQQRQLALAVEAERLATAKKEADRLAKEAETQVSPGAVPSPSGTPVTPVVSPEPVRQPEYSATDLARLHDVAFSQRKGKLPWPVRGNIMERYGQPRQGSLTWEGVRIAAPAGKEVRAVHYGRVVYADWLRGQGMLIILDHGDGFMSLYANNDVLLRSHGEWVQAGDAIARVGNSGGSDKPGVYFEIRRDGKTVDPQPWLGK